MLMIMKALLILLLELLICYLFGTLVCRRCLKVNTNLFANTVIGFFLYQILCQILTLGVYFTTGKLHHLTNIWCAVSVMISTVSLVLCKSELVKDAINIIRKIKSSKGGTLLVVIVVIAFGYYVSINGEINEDSRYYISLINTSASTDTLFYYNVYNGYISDAFYLRRALTTFEIHSAVLCQIFHIHALVLARIMRACQNVVFTGMTMYLCGQVLYNKEHEKKHLKICILVAIAFVLQLVFACNIYTSGTFLLYRAYEGKAFAANMIVMFTMYMSYRFVKEKKKKNAFLLIVIWWGSIAVSSSAMFLVPMAAGIIMIPMLIREKIDARGKKCKE